MSTAPTVVELTSEEVELAHRISSFFARYGKALTLHSDESNLLSVLGEFAYSKFLFDSIEPVLQHRRRSRDYALKTGLIRDGHRDFPCARIDVKATQDRHEKGWRCLNLLVSPAQLRTDTAYASAVVSDDLRSVVLAGWTDSLGLRPNPPKKFRGWNSCAHGLLWPVDELKPEDWPVVSAPAVLSV